MELGDFDQVLDADIMAQLHDLEVPSLSTELIDEFGCLAPGHVARLKAALAAGESTAFRDAAHALPVSAFTASASEEDVRQSIALGPTAYLAKPLNLRLLITRVQRLLP